MKEDNEPDFLEQEIAEHTARNPDYPRLLAEAEERLANSLPIEEVRRLTLQPGDALVIKVPIDIDAEVAKKALEMVSRKFPDHRVIAMPADWDLETIREEALGTESPDDRSPTAS